MSGDGVSCGGYARSHRGKQRRVLGVAHGGVELGAEDLLGVARRVEDSWSGGG